MLHFQEKNDRVPTKEAVITIIGLFSFFEQIPNRERGFFVYPVIGGPFGVTDQARPFFTVERICFPLDCPLHLSGCPSLK